MKKNKIFLITIDTEGDNQWDNNHPIDTKNANYLPRFQELAEKYGFKPVWLTNYEMANDKFFVKYMKDKQNKGLCEIGMHLHAWNNPPEYNLNKKTNERPYLIEYPTNIMEEKIKVLDELLTKKFGKKPISHRSGRWALDERYIKILEKYGYKVDCSVTPNVNWNHKLGATGVGGTDYSKYTSKTNNISQGILEVPMTIRKMHLFSRHSKGLKGFLGALKRLIIGKNQWLRPDKYFNIKELTKLIDKCKNEDYIMFMIHSSELMPFGSPNFNTEEDINKLYEVIENLFSYIKKQGYIGLTLKEYYNYYKGDK